MPTPVKRSDKFDLADALGEAGRARLVAAKANTNGSPSPIPGKKKKKRAAPIVKGELVTVLNKVHEGEFVYNLALDPKLIQTISRHLLEVGLVGEINNGLLGYVAYTSRKLKNPVSLIIRGKSSSGKDMIQRKPAELMPPDDVIEATSLTPNALYYDEPGWLKHKVILGGERAHRTDEDQADRTAAIRQLISQGRITKRTIINMQAVKIEQEGPIVYSETTTATSIFGEDLNRVLQLFTDPSDDQTRQVLMAVAEHYEKSPDQVSPDEIRQLHHDFQESLESVEIWIPFASRLAKLLPVKKVESRRVITQVFSIIEAVTLLYQYQREKDSYGRLIAMPVDYAIARQLLLDPLQQSIGIGAKYQKYQQLREKISNTKFDSNQALAAFNTKVTRDTWLNTMVEIGVLKQIKKGTSHKPAQWCWVDKSAVDELVLPSVSAVTS